MNKRGLIVLVLGIILATFTGYVNVHANEVQPPLLCLLASSFLLGFLQPKGAWRWGLLIGLSIMVSTFVGLAVNFKMIDVPRFPVTLAVLVIPALVAAYAGAFVGGALNKPPQELSH